MSSKIVLSKEAFQKLLGSLVALEEGYQKILDDFFPVINDERAHFAEVITEYIKKLNTTLEHIAFQEECEDRFPYVIIGSMVEVEDMDYGETFTFKYVSPAERDIDYDYISLLSPVGKALLLQEVGSMVVANTPNGVSRYRINSVVV